MLMILTMLNLTFQNKPFKPITMKKYYLKHKMLFIFSNEGETALTNSLTIAKVFTEKEANKEIKNSNIKLEKQEL